MVADKDHPFRPGKRNLKTYKDGDGVHYVVPAELLSGAKGTDAASPRIDVWWNRGPKKRAATGSGPWRTEQEEELIIRQQNGNNIGAYVILLTPGQAYDLIDALNQAVENP